ncbi:MULTISPECIES: site-specific tyrosine recombinase/integron integrase [Roseivirga]|uniref:site-specific tyrosine recombinase/integron integrase n=1 Tax=Roseivirga TaxID=290180 RepID=UPI001B23D630|nr:MULTISPECIES: site-specific tyrosine recombinase/integron integrase [Roseivirga]MBO6495943.1 site-specific integrase [Roseivirga sp.]MBO6662735.1 site-specific integrase [Roseivirga sp.]MBO6909887.1 site-specific integrase [Roseivirga sp.]WPZ10654.1 site-specific tyrosine recombinase/integron integrase [Roseivirga spongicola]
MRLETIDIEGKSFFGIAMPYDTDLIAKAKKLKGRWHPKRKLWLFPITPERKEKLIRAFNLQSSNKSKTLILKEKSKVPKEYLEQLERRRYSPNTIQTYLSLFEKFLSHFNSIEPEQLNDSHVAEFQTYLVSEKKVSTSSQNQYINAIKFYFEKVLGRERGYYHIERPIKEFRLPKVLTEKEVSAILNSVHNLKHKAMLLMVYSSGLRAGELIKLHIGDIDSEQMRVFVRGGKGKKDRVTILSQKALVVLREYFKKYRPKEYLFEGQNGGQYSDSSLRRVFISAIQRAKLSKRVTLHSLRHSFATHLLEKGVDIRYIQVLLGHNSSQTTEIYTHITHKGWEKIQSPLDNLNLDD